VGHLNTSSPRHPTTPTGAARLKALALFVALALLLTFPQVMFIERGLGADRNEVVHDDPLLNTWILAWGAHAVVTNPLDVFDANAFYPRRNTLAYSDHMLGNLPLAAPVFWLSGNPVLAYNVLLLLSFALAGWGAYLLALELTGSVAPALFAGIAYGFSPYRFAQYGHVQILSSHWMPFAMLFLHRFLKSGALRPLTIAFVFTFLQAMSSAYFSLFFPTFVIIFAVAWVVSQPPAADAAWRRLLWLLPFLAALAIVLLPFAWPYIKLRNEMGFTRAMDENVKYSADVLSYLACSDANPLWGALLAWPPTPEGPMFLCLSVLALAALSLRLCFSRTPASEPSSDDRAAIRAYLISAVACFVLSLGPTIKFADRALCPGPYLVLYKFVPGYDGLRVPARFAMILVLALAVLAAFGLKAALARLADRPRTRRVGLLALFALLIVECWHVPLDIGPAPVGDKVPQVYRWLAAQPDDIRLLELPLDIHRNDNTYMYFSAYHWKKLVNGRSGYVPPENIAKFLTILRFPAEPCMDVLREIGVTHVLFHGSAYPTPAETLMNLPEVRLVKRLDDDYVFAVPPRPAVQSPIRPFDDSLIPRTGWRVSASVALPQTTITLDGNPQTAWATQREQSPGEWFAVDLGREWPVAAVRLSFGPCANQLPRDFDLDVSTDGRAWSVVTTNDIRLSFYAHVYRTALHSPRDAFGDIRFPPAPCRYIRIRLTDSAYSDWAIAEINAFTPVPRQTRIRP